MLRNSTSDDNEATRAFLIQDTLKKIYVLSLLPHNLAVTYASMKVHQIPRS